MTRFHQCEDTNKNQPKAPANGNGFIPEKIGLRI